MRIIPTRQWFATALLLLAIHFASTDASAQERPYSLESVETLLRGGVAPTRLRQIIMQACVDFESDAAAEAALRSAGATHDQLEFLRSACRSHPGPIIPLTEGSLTYHPSVLKPLTLDFGIRALLVFSASGTQQLARFADEHGEVVSFTTRQTGPGVDVQYVVVAEARTLAPISYTYTKRESSGITSLRLERVGDRVVGSLSRPRGVSSSIDVSLSENTILPTMEDLLLQSAQLAAGQEMSFLNFDYRTGEPCTLTVRVEGERQVRTPAGEFNSWFLRTHGCGTEFRVYLRKEAPHITLRQEGGGATVELRGLTQ